jgi:hypothetical protein
MSVVPGSIIHMMKENATMTSTLDVDTLVSLAKLDLLMSNGVDNWDWYHDSLEDAGYESSDDSVEDSLNLLNALEMGGVDNWDGYDDSIAGLNEYSDYLDKLDEQGSLASALSFDAWQAAEQVEKEKAAQAKAEADAKAAAAAQAEVSALRGPKNEAEARVAAYLVAYFPEYDTDAAFDKVVNNGLWKRTTFELEFRKALKVAAETKDETAPMNEYLVAAQDALVTILIRKGKLKKFIQETLES